MLPNSFPSCKVNPFVPLLQLRNHTRHLWRMRFSLMRYAALISSPHVQWPKKGLLSVRAVAPVVAAARLKAASARGLSIRLHVLQMSEGRVVESLRAEIATAEAALEAERGAAGLARRGAAERESDLQAQLSEAAQELAAAQRSADSRAAALAAAEERAATAEREHEDLAAQLATAQERLRR